MKVLVLPKSKKESRVNPASIQYNCKIYLLLKNYITKYTKKVNRYCNKIKTVWKKKQTNWLVIEQQIIEWKNELMIRWMNGRGVDGWI